MSALTFLYPYFGSGRDQVIYHKSASELSVHYFILVSDANVYKRTGIRIATFSYDKKDVNFEKAIVRYGNTSPKTRLPNRSFEAAVKDAIRLNEGVYQPAMNEATWFRKIQHKLEGLNYRIAVPHKNKKFRSS